MSTLQINLRKRCAMDAFQTWLDKQQDGLRVVDIVSPDPCQIVLLIEDEDGEVKP